jgi:hypothetical protein
MRDVRQNSLAKLLIVDDEPSIRASMAQVLAEIGYVVGTAPSVITLNPAIHYQFKTGQRMGRRRDCFTEDLAQPKRLITNQPVTSSPMWIQRNANDASGNPYVTIACPKCLRTFQQTVGGSLSSIREADCVRCGNTVYYAIVEPVDWSPEQAPQRTRGAETSAWQPQLQT